MADELTYIKQLAAIIEEELSDVMSDDYEYYKNYNIILSVEQQYVKSIDRNPKAIYIVVKFLDATLTPGAKIWPITISALGEENSIEVCQKLLMEFSTQYNLTTRTLEKDVIKQVYSIPQASSNFNEVHTGFRTLFACTGTFVIGESSNPVVSAVIPNFIYDSETETYSDYNIEFLSAQYSFDNQLDPQAFTGTNNRTVSAPKIGTFSISFTMYVKDDDFWKVLYGIVFGDVNDAPQKNLTSFSVNITMMNGKTYSQVLYLANISGQQTIGNLPSASVSFTN